MSSIKENSRTKIAFRGQHLANLGLAPITFALGRKGYFARREIRHPPSFYFAAAWYPENDISGRRNIPLQCTDIIACIGTFRI